MIPRKQPILKFLLRALLPVFTLAGFGGVASLSGVYPIRSKVLSATWSPGGKYRASLIEVEGDDGCLRGTSYILYVERQWLHIKTGAVNPLCFGGPPASLDVHWSGPEDLVMICHSCDQEELWIDKRNWGRLHYRYDLERE